MYLKEEKKISKLLKFLLFTFSQIQLINVKREKNDIIYDFFLVDKCLWWVYVETNISAQWSIIGNVNI